LTRARTAPGGIARAEGDAAAAGVPGRSGSPPPAWQAPEMKRRKSPNEMSDERFMGLLGRWMR